MDSNIMAKGILTIRDRLSLNLNGVNNIEGFDENYVLLDSELGRLVIEGNNLKIGSLSSEGGDICISGRIDSLHFSEKKVGKGFLSKLFG